jgi:hypothetical protein
MLNLKFKSKFFKTNGLIHHWPFASSIYDFIGGAHLWNGTNAGLTLDRLGRPLSALNLNVGKYELPIRNYFPNINFSITFWFYLRSSSQYSRLIEFSNYLGSDAIMFVPYFGSKLPGFLLRNNNSKNILYLKDTNQIPLKTWIHVGLTFQYPTGSLFLNGSRVSSGTCTERPANITREFNLIGRSSFYPNYKDLNGIVDELKIFDRALSTREIQFEMNNDLFN